MITSISKNNTLLTKSRFTMGKSGNSTIWQLDYSYGAVAVHRPANRENVFRGTFRVKKRDLPAKSGTVGRAHIEIFF